MFPPSCRFYPTCSEYSLESIRRFGAFYGTILSIKRVARCNPFNKGGFDPVPEKINKINIKKFFSK